MSFRPSLQKLTMTVNWSLVYKSFAAEIIGQNLCSETKICLIFLLSPAITKYSDPTRPDRQLAPVDLTCFHHRCVTNKIVFSKTHTNVNVRRCMVKAPHWAALAWKLPFSTWRYRVLTVCDLSRLNRATLVPDAIHTTCSISASCVCHWPSQLEQASSRLHSDYDNMLSTCLRFWTLDRPLLRTRGQTVKKAMTLDIVSVSEGTSEALGYGTHCWGISQFYLHIHAFIHEQIKSCLAWGTSKTATSQNGHMIMANMWTNIFPLTNWEIYSRELKPRPK